jgi:uncharacterized protein HemY
MGQAEEAIAQLGVMYCRGRQCRQTLELDPAFEIAHWYLGLGYESKGMYEKAIAELQIAVASGGCTCKAAALAYTYAITGQGARAQDVLRELKDKAIQATSFRT